MRKNITKDSRDTGSTKRKGWKKEKDGTPGNSPMQSRSISMKKRRNAPAVRKTRIWYVSAILWWHCFCQWQVI
mgnify:CR=1 FL=1